MNLPDELPDELEDELVELLAAAVSKKKVAAALEHLLERERVEGNERLNGPETLEYAATVLAAVVRTCPNREVAFKLFFKSLTKALPEVAVQISGVPHVDKGAS